MYLVVVVVVRLVSPRTASWRKNKVPLFCMQNSRDGQRARIASIALRIQLGVIRAMVLCCCMISTYINEKSNAGRA